MYTRGGFTPFRASSSLSGLGELDEFGNEMGSGLPTDGHQTFTGDAAQNYVVSKIAGIPSWALLVGGFFVAALLLPSGRR